MLIPEITKKIHQLYISLKATDASTEQIAERINAILLHVEGVTRDELISAWMLYGVERGVRD